MFSNGISVFSSLIGLLILINLSKLTAGEKERFSNFYAAPDNIELIAMASDHSPHHSHHQRSSSSPSHHNQHSRQSSPRSEFRGKSSSPSSSSPPSPRKPSHSEYSSDEPRFSIGLGTLAPSYSQKFGADGRTRLDFDHRSNGFSYSLTNNHHPEPKQDQQPNYADSPHDSKDGNVKIYYDQRFSPYAAAETNNYFSRVPFVMSNTPAIRPLQGQSPLSSRFADLFAKYAPKGDEKTSEYRDESGSDSPPQSSFYSGNSDEGRSSDGSSSDEYQSGMYNPRYDESENRKPDGPSGFGAGDYEGGSFLGSNSDDGGSGDEGYTFPLPFHKKDGSDFLMRSHPEGSLEFVSRIGSHVGSGDLNDFGSNSGLEPVVFSSNIGHYSGLDNNDAFSAYIAGLPLTP